MGLFEEVIIILHLTRAWRNGTFCFLVNAVLFLHWNLKSVAWRESVPRWCVISLLLRGTDLETQRLPVLVGFQLVKLICILFALFFFVNLTHLKWHLYGAASKHLFLVDILQVFCFYIILTLRLLLILVHLLEHWWWEPRVSSFLGDTMVDLVILSQFSLLGAME